MNDSRKVMLVTGGTDGIGREIATGLARAGGIVIVAGRNADRGRAAVEALKAAGADEAEFLAGDLSSQSEVRRLASEFAARHSRLDVLVNNAGALYGRRFETVDGIEATLALNHLSPFLLTHLLLPLLRNAPAPRIVNINSEGHRVAATFEFEAFEGARWKRGFLVYGASKLGNLLFTYELARRVAHTGMTVNAVHPGMVDTQLVKRFVSERFQFLGPRVSRITMWLASHLAHRLYRFDTAEKAAECPIYLAASDAVAGVTGKYFNSDKQAIESSPASYDENLFRAVWNRSAELVNLP